MQNSYTNLNNAVINLIRWRAPRKSFLNCELRVSSWSKTRETVAVNRDFRVKTVSRRSAFLIRGWRVDALPYIFRAMLVKRLTFKLNTQSYEMKMFALS